MSLIRPFPFFIILFSVVHLLSGIDIYFDNKLMMFSTAWFLLVLYIPSFLIKKSNIDIVSVVNQVYEEFYNSKGFLLFVFFITSLSGLYILLQYVSGFGSMYDLRRNVTELLPGSVLLIFSTINLIVFAILLILSIKKYNDELNYSYFSFALLLYGVLSNIGSGSRSSVLIFVFLFVFLYYLFGRLKVSTITYIFVAAFSIVGILSYYRIVTSGELGHIKWYIDEGILVEGNPILSAINLIVFQARDIVVRSSEIFSNVPLLLDYQNGRSLLNGFYQSFDSNYVNPHVDVHHKIFGVGGEFDTGYPPTFASQYWLDFGIYGVIFLPILYSLLFWFLFAKLVIKPRLKIFIMYVTFCYFTLLSLYGAFEVFRFVLICFSLLFVRFLRVRL